MLAVAADAADATRYVFFMPLRDTAAVYAIYAFLSLLPRFCR